MESRLPNLLTWLANHGMKLEPDVFHVECRARPGAGNGLFTIGLCPPSTVLFNVPASAMMNTKTLARCYPSYTEGLSLSATQLISLHLMLNRPIGDGESMDSLFGPYISVMPRDFDSHPVTWVVRQRVQQATCEMILLENLTPSARTALDKVSQKFFDDWETTSVYMENNTLALRSESLESNTKADTSALLMDFLWAWLNVNTRCIYYQVKPSRSDPDNLTMCPILDFANHTSSSKHMSPVPLDARAWNSHQKYSRDLAFLSPRGCLQENEEVYLCYGAHANRTLFVEYGFVNALPKNPSSSDDFNGEIDVQDIVEHLFEEKGEEGSWMREVLEDRGYWGDWTLHACPRPAYPSFRLITALRLYHSVASSSSEASSKESILDPWQDTILGRRIIISENNETSWRGTLGDICQLLMRRAEIGMSRLADQTKSYGDVQWLPWMRDNIGALWEEEAHVAAAVAESVRSGVQF